LKETLSGGYFFACAARAPAEKQGVFFLLFGQYSPKITVLPFSLEK